MKKLLIIGIAALAALAMVTCDGAPVDVSSAGGGITLGATGIGGRALTPSLAQAGADYFEATFIRTSDSKILRASWSWSRKGKIDLAPDTYNVVLFAGRNDDKTLLGIGKAAIVRDGGTNTTIADTVLAITTTTSTTEIVFAVEPLVNNINTLIMTADTVTDTDDIEEAVSTFYVGTTRPPADTNPTETTHIVDDLLKSEIPVFMIDQAVNSRLHWIFGIGARGADNRIGFYDSFIVVRNGGGTAFKAGFSGLEGLDIPEIIDINYVGPTGTNPITGGDITFEATAPGAGKDGMVKMAIEVPVCAVEDTVEAITWYIRGGLNNSVLDGGVSPIQPQGSLGGAVVLGFGELSNLPKISLTRQ